MRALCFSRLPGLACLLGIFGVWCAEAQLPLARLSTITPPVGRPGSTFDITVDGEDLDHLKELRFSHPGITAKAKSNTTFEVTIGPETPCAVYDARVVGRFGISTARGFAVEPIEFAAEPSGIDSPGGAAKLEFGKGVYGQANPTGVDHYKFEAASGQFVAIDCLAGALDSRMQPNLVVTDPAGREIARSRNGAPILFRAGAAGEYRLRMHDLQFRGGPAFFYALALSSRPQVDFVLPPAGRPGTRGPFTVYGRNLPGSEAANLGPVGGQPLEKLAVEIELPASDAPEARRLRLNGAGVAVRGIEYRWRGTNGLANPFPITLAASPVAVEPQDPAAPPLKVEVPIEFTGRIDPSSDRDAFEFEGKKGDVLSVEVLCQRLGLPESLFVLVQRVTRDSAGKESLADVLEISPSDSNIGGPLFRTVALDGAGRLDVKEDGTYRATIRSLYPAAPANPARVYRVAVRKEAPDFELAALPLAPLPVNRDTRPGSPWGSLLRKGESLPVEVVVLRRDNLNGPISLSAAGLPEGLRAEPGIIPSGANKGTLFLTATENAAAWAGTIEIVGQAKVGEQELRRVARAGQVLWEVADYNTQYVPSRLCDGFAVAISDTERAPLSIEPAESKAWEVAPGGKLSIPLKVARHGQFANSAQFKPTGHPALDPAPNLEISGTATNATLELDLNREKLPEGEHRIWLFGRLKGQYRKLTEAEAAQGEQERAAADVAAKAAEKEMADLAETAKTSPEAAERRKKAEAAKAEATERAKRAAERIQTREVNAPIWSAPILVKVTAPAKVAAK